jgi:hypothetical protein
MPPNNSESSSWLKVTRADGSLWIGQLKRPFSNRTYGLHRFKRLLKSLTGSATSLILDLQVDLDTVSGGCPFVVQLSRALSFQRNMVD